MLQWVMRLFFFQMGEIYKIIKLEPFNVCLIMKPAKKFTLALDN